MGAGDTTYDVMVRYKLDSGARSSFDGLGDSIGHSEAKARGLIDTVKELGIIAAGGFGLHEGKHYLIDANSEFEQMKIGMAAVSAYNMKVPFQEAADQTDRLIEGWQTFSKSTVLTTRQLTEFGQQMEGGALSAGATVKEFDELVKRGAVVGNVLGAGHQGGLSYVGTEFREALSGNVRKTQIFNTQLLGPAMKAAGKQLEDFNTMTARERLEIIQKALSDPAWDSAITRQRESFSGVTSTLKDNLEIALRQVGLPLFKEITAEVKGWNEWIERNPKAIEEFGQKFGHALVEGFEAVKGIVGFIVEHKELLLTIGSVWALSKVGGMKFGGVAGLLGGGGVGQGAGMAMSAAGAGAAGYGLAQAQGMDQLQSSTMAVTSAMMGLPGPIAAVGVALTGLQLGLNEVDKKQREAVERKGELGTYERAIGSGQKLGDRMDDLHAAIFGSGADKEAARKAAFDAALPTLIAMRSSGVTGEEAFTEAGLRRATSAAFDASKDETGVGDPEVARRFGETAIKAMQTAMDLDPERLKNFFGLGRRSDEAATKNKSVNAPPQHITISKIEVQSPDPDRFAFGLTRAFKKLAKNPVTADRALRGGF